MSEATQAGERRRNKDRGDRIRREERDYDDDDIAILNWADGLLDPSPITAELLKQLGFGGEGELRLVGDKNDLVWDGCLYVLGDYDRADVAVSTLGSLRMLCSALNIPLPPPQREE